LSGLFSFSFSASDMTVLPPLASATIRSIVADPHAMPEQVHILEALLAQEVAHVDGHGGVRVRLGMRRAPVVAEVLASAVTRGLQR
jgi:hypothetical protein